MFMYALFRIHDRYMYYEYFNIGVKSITPPSIPSHHCQKVVICYKTAYKPTFCTVL